METGTVKWIHYSEYSGQPLRWTRGHSFTDDDVTLCGRVIPRGDDRLLVVDYGCEATCCKCRAVLEATYQQSVKQESRASDLKALKRALSDTTGLLRFGLFTMDECKASTGVDGRILVHLLRGMGYKRTSSGLWHKPIREIV